MVTAAYAAGLFDGEGCVFITRSFSRGKTPGFRHYLRVQINMSHQETIATIHSQYGGAMRTMIRANVRPIYSVVMSAEAAKKFLEEIQQFSITKRKEIDVALEFLDLPIAKSHELQKVKEEYYWKLRKLKRPVQEGEVSELSS